MNILQDLTRLLPVIAPGVFAFLPLILKVINHNRELNPRVVLKRSFYGDTDLPFAVFAAGFSGGGGFVSAV